LVAFFFGAVFFLAAAFLGAAFFTTFFTVGFFGAVFFFATVLAMMEMCVACSFCCCSLLLLLLLLAHVPGFLTCFRNCTSRVRLSVESIMYCELDRLR
jgi:hypothetical protein